MKYNQPLDQPSTPNAPYVDGNASTGVEGSVVGAASVEFDQREIVNVIKDIGLANPDNSDLAQMSAAVRFMRTQYVLDSNVPNQIQVALNPSPVAWATPIAFFVKMGATNTQTTVTCQIVGLASAKPVVLRDGSLPKVGDLAAGTVHLLVYDGTSMRALTTVPSEKPQGFFSLTETSPSPPNQTALPNSVPTMIAHMGHINASSFLDPASSLASSRLTVGPRDAGLWYLDGYYGLHQDPGASGPGAFAIALCINGGEIIGFTSSYQPGATAGLQQTLLWRLAAGDVIQVQATNFSGYTGYARAAGLMGVRISG